MSHLDSELNSLRLRLVALEEQKRIETEIVAEKKTFPLKTLDDFVDKKKDQVQNNRYSKSIPLARFYDQEKLEYLQPILDMLKNIQGRLEALEKKE
jgi:hypothetical protein